MIILEVVHQVETTLLPVEATILHRAEAGVTPAPAGAITLHPVEVEAILHRAEAVLRHLVAAAVCPADHLAEQEVLPGKIQSPFPAA